MCKFFASRPNKLDKVVPPSEDGGGVGGCLGGSYSVAVGGGAAAGVEGNAGGIRYLKQSFRKKNERTTVYIWKNLIAS